MLRTLELVLPCLQSHHVRARHILESEPMVVESDE